MPGRTREFRKAQRKPRRQAAWISYGDPPGLVPCVIWDLTDGGARLASARLNALPQLFTLNLSKDGSSSRSCRVVWRKKPHVGVQFIEAAEAAELAARQARGRYAGGPAHYVAMPVGGAANSLSLELRALNAPAQGMGASRATLSCLAFGLLLLLFVATAVFYVAGMQVADGSSWASEVCSYAANFCQNPEWSGVPAAVIGLVFLVVKRREL